MRRLLLSLTMVAIAVLVSCNPDEMAAPQLEPAFLIQDGAHGGNGHFFFLPPLVVGLKDGTIQSAWFNFTK